MAEAFEQLASCRLAEPSSSLLASFLFLANCYQTRRSTLAPLCFTRVLSASNYRFLLAFPSCSCQLSMSIYGFRPSSFLTDETISTESHGSSQKREKWAQREPRQRASHCQTDTKRSWADVIVSGPAATRSSFVESEPGRPPVLSPTEARL